MPDKKHTAFFFVLVPALLLALMLAGQWVLSAASHAYQKYPLPMPAYILLSKATALEKMQMIMEYVRKEEIEAKRKAGEPVHFGSIEVTSQPEGAGVLVSS